MAEPDKEVVPKCTTQILQSGKVNQRFKIQSVYQAAMDVGIKASLEWLSLTQSATPVPAHGSKPLKDNSLLAYAKHINGLQYMCALLGDHDSQLCRRVAVKFITHDCKVAMDNPVVMPIYISNTILNVSRTKTLRQELNQLLSTVDPLTAAKLNILYSRILTEATYQNTGVEPVVIQIDHDEEEDGDGADVSQMNTITINNQLGHSAVALEQHTHEQQGDDG
ncbi:hypothetical protein BJ741DRAFT_675363 [Chytriomyces cf. hyalinus JEL632]|nr:hypothetical protein BJ741DRAFT_675363 [Chytriomyces cf. hyalinus JEL632]